MKSTLLGLSLLAVLLGFAACAKYPVVIGASGEAAPAPTASTTSQR